MPGAPQRSKVLSYKTLQWSLKDTSSPYIPSEHSQLTLPASNSLSLSPPLSLALTLPPSISVGLSLFLYLSPSSLPVPLSGSLLHSVFCAA